MPHEVNETLRKWLHIAIGFGAPLLLVLPWWAAAAVAAAAVFGNWLLLHRLFGRRVSRHERGYDAGTILYPVMVLLLIVVFRDRLVVAAIAWTTLAFGDGFATLVAKARFRRPSPGAARLSSPAERERVPPAPLPLRGRGQAAQQPGEGLSLRIAPLPWNRDKSWGGFLTFLLTALAAGIAMNLLFGTPLSWTAVILAVAAAAIAESLPTGLDDNVTVPIAAATVLTLAILHPPGALHVDIPWLIANTVLALLGYFARSVDLSGLITGWLLGNIILIGGGWPLYVVLLTFFVIGTACTKLGYSRKAKKGLAQEKGGRRGASHAFSNVGVATICAIAYWRSGGQSLYFFAAAASLATAAADTTASEIGQLIGKRPFLPLSLRRVEPGTEGAISIEGTLAGLVAAAIVAVVAVFVSHRPAVAPAILIALAAFAGSYLESIAGAWNRRHGSPVANGTLNFFNTAAGALLFGLAARLLHFG